MTSDHTPPMRTWSAQEAVFYEAALEAIHGAMGAYNALIADIPGCAASRLPAAAPLNSPFSFFQCEEDR